MAERITTLLQDRLPLDPDRRLKVPAIRPEDDMVTVRRRLGRYLYDSLAKDTDRETLAVETANAIWPGCETIGPDSDAEVARDLERTGSKTGTPAIALRHPKGRIIIIGLGPHRPMLARIDYRYRLSKRTVDTVSLPSLLAARMIMGHMAAPDPEGEIRDMLSDDRHTWRYFRTNMDRLFDGVDGLVVSCNSHGVGLPTRRNPAMRGRCWHGRSWRGRSAWTAMTRGRKACWRNAWNGCDGRRSCGLRPRRSCASNRIGA